jgi:hypothetical protein
LLLCTDRDWLYLLAEVHDATRDGADARDQNATLHDHLTLTLERGGIVRSYLLASAAPGNFDARTLTGSDDEALPAAMSGAWQENSSGYRVELRLPLAQLPDRLAMTAYDSAAPAPEFAEPRRLLRHSAALSQQLAQFAPEDMRVRLLSSEGWVIADAGRLQPGKADEARANSQRRWLENLVYRRLIAPGLTQAQDFATTLPRVAAPEIWQALSGADRGPGRACSGCAAAIGCPHPTVCGSQHFHGRSARRVAARAGRQCVAAADQSGAAAADRREPFRVVACRRHPVRVRQRARAAYPPSAQCGRTRDPFRRPDGRRGPAHARRARRDR